jgi:hypothetical protein
MRRLTKVGWIAVIAASLFIVAVGGIFPLYLWKPGSSSAQISAFETAVNTRWNSAPVSARRRLAAMTQSALESKDVYPVANLAADYDRLAAMADAGDQVAARTLLRTLGMCRSAPGSRDALNVLGAHLHDAAYVYENLPGGADAFFEFQKMLFEKCGENSPAHFDGRRKWASILAEAGDSAARIEFAVLGQPSGDDVVRRDYQDEWQQFRTRAREYLGEEIDDGNRDALLAMANGYMPSTSANHSSTFTPDAASAYAYYYAYAQDQDRAEAVVGILARLELELSSAALDHARAEGEQVYAKCCAARQPSS